MFQRLADSEHCIYNCMGRSIPAFDRTDISYGAETKSRLHKIHVLFDIPNFRTVCLSLSDKKEKVAHVDR